MSNIYIINGHQPAPISEGRLNATLVAMAKDAFEAAGHQVKTARTAEPYDTETEVTAFQWADLVIMQYPVNWMGVPWGFKKYLDDVLSAGLDARLCDGDGRSAAAPKENYGMGGVLTDTHYMISVTFNAPAEAFEDPSQAFFGGRSVDDLLWPMHLNAKFIGMRPMPTFSAHDVLKNPDIENDLARFGRHLKMVLQRLAVAKALAA